jgi:hypothetical protein
MSDGHFEKVACITCHRGHETPSADVDTTRRGR